MQTSPNQTLEKVSELIFSDLFLGPNASWLGGSTEQGIDPVAAPDSAREDLVMLKKLCEETSKGTPGDFRVLYDSVHYRVTLLESMSGTVYVLRRSPVDVPSLHDLGLHKGLIKKLMAENLTGLLVIAGPTGSGKTTTANAIVKERLIEFGGIAVTAEEPPEMPLEGMHGKGVCWQTSVTRDTGGFAEASRKYVRWNPDIIFLGEIRESEGAMEALRASINGHLVITTVHSDDVQKAIHRLYVMAEDFTNTTSSGLLAEGLLGVIHQKLEGNAKKILKTEFLFLDGDSIGARKNIRDGKFEMLANEIQAQRNRMQMENIPSRQPR